jgi:hypothetical protein
MCAGGGLSGFSSFSLVAFALCVRLFLSRLCRASAIA